MVRPVSITPRTTRAESYLTDLDLAVCATLCGQLDVTRSDLLRDAVWVLATCTPAERVLLLHRARCRRSKATDANPSAGA